MKSPKKVRQIGKQIEENRHINSLEGPLERLSCSDRGRGMWNSFLVFGQKTVPPPTKKSVWARIQPKSIAVLGDLLRKLRAAIEQRTGAREAYPVVIINWVQYLGPPVPFSFPDSRDLLEVSARLVNVRVNKTVERGDARV